MAERSKEFVFHVRRKNGTPIFLHPFTTPARLMDVLPTAEIAGRYGAEPVVEALTGLRNELYRMVDASVRLWIGELRFIPRFLISTAVFLVVYFVTSYFIRDPLPIIDELVLGLVAAVVAFLWLGRRYGASQQATARRAELRAAVDRISFTESSFLKRVEEVLHDHEAHELQTIRSILTPLEHTLDADERVEAEHLVSMLERRLDLRRLKRDERVLKRFVDRGAPGESTIRRWLESQKLDAPLYALYKGFKRTVQAPRP